MTNKEDQRKHDIIGDPQGHGGEQQKIQAEAAGPHKLRHATRIAYLKCILQFNDYTQHEGML